jgi:hypothetical protein
MPDPFRDPLRRTASDSSVNITSQDQRGTSEICFASFTPTHQISKADMADPQLDPAGMHRSDEDMDDIANDDPSDTIEMGAAPTVNVLIVPPKQQDGGFAAWLQVLSSFICMMNSL